MADRRLIAAVVALAPCTVAAQDGPPVEVPSGQPVAFHEVIRDASGPAGLTYRFRFIAPEIARDGGGVDFDTASVDMEHLCNAFALPRISNLGPQPAQIVVSLADRATPFGTPAPDATQYFEAYRIENGVCIWEGF